MPTADEKSRDAVVVVHGLAAHPVLMIPLARWLEESFGRVINWGYPSLWSPIERHGQKLADLLRQLDRDDTHDRIHIVAHSMGAIVSRVALAEYLPGRFGRFVMISPPNRGSRLASRVAPLLGRVLPPVSQLTDHGKSFVCSLPLPTVAELGIIAARIDLLVQEPSTHLDCERDHIILPGRHTTFIWRRETAKQVRHFLQNGRFQRA